jgi:hypothetical protein
MGQILEHMVLQEMRGVFEPNVPEIVLPIFCLTSNHQVAVITGHPDHVEFEEIDGKKVSSLVLETKSMHWFPFKKAKEEGIPLQYPAYMWQIAIYVVGTSSWAGEFLMIDRASGAEDVQLFTLDQLLPYYEQAMYRARAIACLVEAGVLPKKDPNLPKWCCSADYCGAVECEHLKSNGNFTSEKKRPRAKRKAKGG